MDGESIDNTRTPRWLYWTFLTGSTEHEAPRNPPIQEPRPAVAVYRPHDMTGWTYFCFPPSRQLAPFVRNLWGVRGTAFYHVESTLPDGTVQLMVSLGPSHQVVAYGDRRANDEFSRAWVAGIQDQPLVHASPAGSDALGSPG